MSFQISATNWHSSVWAISYPEKKPVKEAKIPIFKSLVVAAGGVVDGAVVVVGAVVVGAVVVGGLVVVGAAVVVGAVVVVVGVELHPVRKAIPINTAIRAMLDKSTNNFLPCI